MNENMIVELVLSVLIIIGVMFTLLSALGLIRLPDIYTRSHAVSKSATLGVMCTLFAVFLFFAYYNGYFSIRLLLGIIFVFLTAPVTSHLLTRAAYSNGTELTKNSAQDDLKEYYTENEK
ncbi:monovalent cation/H(+) antiporter subunit G [Sutcliffiella cohnii]|nr:monovalent cation/H(+) antiporter subunit G [Sutcliffiella cohnii]